MPISPAPSTTERTASTPSRWPKIRSNPCCSAQRPLPSMMMATCFGILSVFNSLECTFPDVFFVHFTDSSVLPNLPVQRKVQRSIPIVVEQNTGGKLCRIGSDKRICILVSFGILQVVYVIGKGLPDTQ